MTVEPIEVSVNGQDYKVGKLTLRDACELTRLVLPIIPVAFTEIVLTIKAKFDNGEIAADGGIETVATLLALSEPILARIARMPSEDFWKCIVLALSCAERKVDKGWAKCVRDGQIMFADIGTPEACRILWEVILREIRPMLSSFGG